MKKYPTILPITKAIRMQVQIITGLSLGESRNSANITRINRKALRYPIQKRVGVSNCNP